MNSNESLLWEGFKHGDAGALFTIYELLYDNLRRNGLAITTDEELVKDTINQFFLYLWDKRDSLQPPEHLKAYIIVSFRRKLLYDIKMSRKTTPLTFEEDLPEASWQDELIEGQTQLERQLRIKKAIDNLPRRQRELITLKYYEGLSYEQIADRTALSMRTIYNKLHEAIKTLKNEILWLLIFYYLK
jgi:RNA polymerase sigma factor (sigma-70 family)